MNKQDQDVPAGRLVSVNVGLPRDILWRGRTVRTGIWKEAVKERRMVHRLNVEGDGQGDLQGHGGENRAVMVYQTESYRYWEAFLGRNDFTFGQFGENFTVSGLPDDQVCIGDRYQIGGALFEVTQPRVTCYRVGIRMDQPEMAAMLVSHHRPGFYFRVLQEGEVGPGDEIIKVADGAERITVAEIDALLYLPGHSREKLKSSLRVPALSEGWKRSLQTLYDQGSSNTGNPGLTASAGPPPGWPGFRPLRVVEVARESAQVISLSLAPSDSSPLPAALPGQFLVLRLHVQADLPPILRNYSLSGAPGASTYRISIKQEVNGTASSFLHTKVNAGDILEASAPRGNFTLRQGDGPVVLISAGIGATPVLSMLHALASTVSPREVWWLYGARNRNEHSFLKESQSLLQKLARARSHIVYSHPDAEDRLGTDFDAPGHLDLLLLDRLGIPSDADFYLCGPQSFLADFSVGLTAWGARPTEVHTELFGPNKPMTPGIVPQSAHAPHPPLGTPGAGVRVSFTRSGLTVPWNPSFQSLLELAEACEVPAKWSCRTGVCHTCECALIGGTVHYQPEPLDPPGQGNLLICCSQPGSDVEIDL